MSIRDQRLKISLKNVHYSEICIVFFWAESPALRALSEGVQRS